MTPWPECAGEWMPNDDGHPAWECSACDATSPEECYLNGTDAEDQRLDDPRRS